MSEQIIITLDVDAEGAVKGVSNFEKATKDAGKQAEKTADQTEDIGKAANKSDKQVGLLGKGFKALGGAMKAAGIGVIVAVVAKLTEAFSNNQAVLDGFNKVMETINIVFTQFTTAVTDAFEKVSNATGGFQSMTKVVKGLMTLALTPLKLIFDGIKLTIQQAQLAWEESFFGDNDPETIKELKANIKDTQESIRETGEEAAQAGRQVADNFGGMIDELGQFYEEASKNVEKIDVKAAKSSADRLVQLRNEAELAEAQLAGLTLKFQQQAEVLRQERDDIRLSIEDRIKANEELGEVLQKQSEEELKLANKRLALAREELRQNPEKIENQKALQEALNGVAEVEERITGQKSEQRTNEAALLDERRANLKELERIGKSERELAELEAEQEAERQRELIERTISNEQEKKDRLLAVEQEYQDKISVLEKEAAERQKKIDQEVQNQKIATVKNALVALQGFTKQGTELNKAAAIAGVLTDSASAAIGIWKNSTDVAFGPLAIAYRVAQTAALAASTVSAIRNIRQVQAPTVGGGGGNASAPSVASGGGATAPNFTIAGDQGQNQLADILNNQNQNPVKAYVVGSDVTSQQQLDRLTRSNATLG